MKKVFCLILCLFVLVGCKSEKQTETEKVLKVGMECDSAPYNWTDVNPTVKNYPISGKDGYYCNGYDVQVSAYIASKLGYKLEVYAYDWDSLIPAVNSGAIDAIIAGMSPTEERAKVIDFTNVYYDTNFVIVTKADSYKDANSLADFNGAKLAGQAGTIHSELAEQINYASFTELKTVPDELVALNSNGVDGFICEEPQAISICESNDDVKYIKLVNNQNGFTTTVEQSGLAIGCKKGSELTEKINQILTDAGFDSEKQSALMEEMVKVSLGQEIELKVLEY